jgi:hypothetical protein
METTEIPSLSLGGENFRLFRRFSISRHFAFQKLSAINVTRMSMKSEAKRWLDFHLKFIASEEKARVLRWGKVYPSEAFTSKHLALAFQRTYVPINRG